MLAVPYVFTQTGVLTPRRFIQEAEERGFDVSLDQLAALSEVGLLAPMFELVDDADPQLDVHTTAARCEWPFEQHVAEQRVADPVLRSSDVSADDLYRYSAWQLIWFHAAGWDQLVPNAPDQLRAAMRAGAELVDHLLELSAAQRRLAVALEVLSASYLPSVRHVIRGGRGNPDWSPAGVLGAEEIRSWLNVDAHVLHAQAQTLLVAAHGVDPLGSWAPLTGHCSTNAREKLRGFARLALDLREAAELLLQAYEDLPNRDRPTEVPPRIGEWWQPMHERLARPVEERDRILNDLGLSPFPTLIIAVEGQTEELLVARTLEVFGRHVGMRGIELARLRGVGNDVGVLARYAGAPRFAEELDDRILLSRPLAHIAVIADPEGPYATEADRIAVKQQLVDDLVRSVPERLRTELLAGDMSTLVSVDTWGGYGGPFEFAHFTDAELADALLDVCDAAEVDRQRLMAAFAGQRRNPAPDVGKVLSSALIKAHRPPSKLQFASVLWDLLEPAVHAAASSKTTTTSTPIAQLCHEALEHQRRVLGIKALRF